MIESLQFLSENGLAIGAGIITFVAGFDKMAQVVITSMANIRDTWRQHFPKKPNFTTEFK